MMNRYPYTVGHLMAVPYKKTSEMSALGENEIVDLWNLVTHGQALLRAAAKAQGFNVGLNLGECAGAGVADHLHISHRAALEWGHEFHADHRQDADAVGWIARALREVDRRAG